MIEFASLGHRMVAVVIDTAILFMVPLWVVYFTLLEGAFGQTIGKRLANIKVVKADGGEITYSKALIRNLLRFIDAIGPGPAPYILGMIIIMITKNKQRLGDMAAGTIVIIKDTK